MHIFQKLTGILLVGIGIQAGVLNAQALRPGAPVVPGSQPQAAVASPAPSLPAENINQQPPASQPSGRTSDANPFLPGKASPNVSAQEPVAAGLSGQTLGAPSAVQPNFNGQFPINPAQGGGVTPPAPEAEEKVHPVIERGTYIGKVNGRPIYKAPREYYFDSPGAEVIYRPKQELAPVGEQAAQPGQRGSRPVQRQTNTNR